MNRAAFLAELSTILEVPPSLLNEGEPLTNIKGWDSLAAVSFIALAHSKCGLVVRGDALAKCETVGDLVGLVSGKLE